MTGKCIHVGDDHSLSPRGRGSANALPEFDLQTADRADIRTDNETVTADAIETGPVEMFEAVCEDGVDRRHQGDVVEAPASLIAPDSNDRLEALFVC